MQTSSAENDIATRAETVINVTMAELDVYHTQKNEDFKGIISDHLDGEINHYEQVSHSSTLQVRTGSEYQPRSLRDYGQLEELWSDPKVQQQELRLVPERLLCTNGIYSTARLLLVHLGARRHLLFFRWLTSSIRPQDWD